jgi:hypothetical protein
MSTFGPAFDEEKDENRLARQNVKIRQLMIDGNWRSLNEISNILNFPEASVSAQLRHLRKPRFGAFLVRKRRRTVGTWEYQVTLPELPSNTEN